MSDVPRPKRSDPFSDSPSELEEATRLGWDFGQGSVGTDDEWSPDGSGLREVWSSWSSLLAVADRHGNEEEFLRMVRGRLAARRRRRSIGRLAFAAVLILGIGMPAVGVLWPKEPTLSIPSPQVQQPEPRLALESRAALWDLETEDGLSVAPSPPWWAPWWDDGLEEQFDEARTALWDLESEDGLSVAIDGARWAIHRLEIEFENERL